MRPTLFVQVENQVREFDAKLLFACIAAGRGFPVVLGNKLTMHFAMPKFSPGIFIAKSMRARSKLMFDIVAGLGHELVAWDEESLVRYDAPEYYDWRFSPSTFNHIKHLFAWGADDAEMFAAYPGNKGVHIHPTGNPRADLLRPELRPFFAEDCAALKQRFGDYILINTNFNFTNPFLKGAELAPAAGRFWARKSRAGFGLSPEFAQAMAAHQQQIFAQFREMLPVLARRFPTRKIVVRPHPSENHDTWRRLLKGCDNVEVCHEGNVIPWLMSAAVLIHNGCTTAVEATLAEKPVVAFRPVHSQTFDYALPNSLSHEATTIEAVVDCVDAILKQELGMIDAGKRLQLFQRHLCATDGEFASERIVSLLESLGYAERQFQPKLADVVLARSKSVIRTGIKRFNMRRRNHWASSRYIIHRYPGVSTAEVNARIARFARFIPTIPPLMASPCGEQLFMIRRTGDAD